MLKHHSAECRLDWRENFDHYKEGYCKENAHSFHELMLLDHELGQGTSQVKAPAQQNTSIPETNDNSKWAREQY